MSSSELRPLPKIFILELTKRCNNSCVYCYASWKEQGSTDGHGSHDEMTTEEIKAVVSKLQNETRIESIGLSGGEPLLREDLPEILSFIRGKGIVPVIITNGTLLTKERVDATMIGGNYEVTLLSYRRETHDHLSGHSGAWDAVVEGMINVREAGGNLTAVFVATKLNWTDLANTAELGIALGVNGLMYNRINLGIHNLRFSEQLLPTPAMIQENLDTLEEIGKTYGIPIVASVVIEPCVVDVQKYKHIHFGWCPLAGEDSYFTIDPMGNVRICNHSPVILGNINQECFSNIYYNHPYVQYFRKTWPLECISCSSQLREICCGGCKAAAEQCYGTIEQVDPFVTLSKKH